MAQSRGPKIGIVIAANVDGRNVFYRTEWRGRSVIRIAGLPDDFGAPALRSLPNGV
jgi:hypothetical protein